MSDSEYRVLDLFCGLGGFSQSFAESDRWDVTAVDIEERFSPDIQADVFDLRPSDFEQDFDVVLASPPCELLSFAGNNDKWNHETKQPTHPESANHTALAHHTIGLIKGLAPRFWFLENPNGRMNWVLERDPEGVVTYCQYGESYFKQTFLWGHHPPMKYRSCSNMDTCHETTPQRNGGSTTATYALPDTYEKRSVVPYNLSTAIRESCEQAFNGETPEQVELGECSSCSVPADESPSSLKEGEL
jgi:hypothetical protein